LRADDTKGFSYYLNVVVAVPEQIKIARRPKRIGHPRDNQSLRRR
jgi:hypothetical protein